MITPEEANQKADKIVNLIVPKDNYNRAKQFVASKVKGDVPLLDKLAQIKYPDRFPGELTAEEEPYAKQIALGITVILCYEKLQATTRKMLQNGEPVNGQSIIKRLEDENIRIDTAIQKTEDRIANDIGYIYDPKYIQNIHNADASEKIRREYDQETLSSKIKLPKLHEKLEINLMVADTIRQKKDFDQAITSAMAMESPKVPAIPPIPPPISPETKAATEASTPLAKSFVQATQDLEKQSQSQNQAPAPSSISTPQADAALAKPEDDFDFNQVRGRREAVTKQSEESAPPADKKSPKHN